MATPETPAARTRAPDADASLRAPALHRATHPDAVGLLSARCCSPDAAALDQPLLESLAAAMAEAGVDAEVHVETVTDLQREMAAVGRELDEGRRELAGRIAFLFATRRLAAFPMLLVGGRIASAGGVPPTRELVEALRRFQAARDDRPGARQSAARTR